MKQDKLLELASKYGFANVKARIEGLNDAITLNIGVLGEFSSGKSTLINAMLNRKVLPAMDKPTTGSIIELEPKSDLDALQYFCRKEDDVLQKISALEFNDIAMGKCKGVVVLQAPAQGMLHDGYRIIDTPGLSSLNQAHTDITFGYLPRLDGAIICQDINKGGLTQSVLDFLKRPEVTPFINNFLFVLTRADQKTDAAVEKVRIQFVQTLQEALDDQNGDFNERVITVSAKNALENEAISSFEDFQSSFQTCFVERKRNLIDQRIKKECQILGTDILKLLQDKRSNTSLNNEELEKKEVSLQTEIDALKRSQNKEDDRLRSLKNEIEQDLQNITSQYSSTYENATDEEASSITSELLSAITKAMESKIQNYVEGFTMPSLTHMGKDLELMVTRVNKNKEIGTTIGSAALMAVVSAGASLAANAAEAGAGAALKTVASKEALKQTGKVVAKEIGKETLKQTGKVMVKKVAIDMLLGTLKIVDQVNPVNYIGESIAQSSKKSRSIDILENISQNISYVVCDGLRMHFDKNIFTPLTDACEDKKNSLKQIWADKEATVKEQRELRRSLDEDILNISSELID